jgi:hypothetical protein
MVTVMRENLNSGKKSAGNVDHDGRELHGGFCAVESILLEFRRGLEHICEDLVISTCSHDQGGALNVPLK